MDRIRVFFLSILLLIIGISDFTLYSILESGRGPINFKFFLSLFAIFGGVSYIVAMSNKNNMGYMAKYSRTNPPFSMLTNFIMIAFPVLMGIFSIFRTSVNFYFLIAYSAVCLILYLSIFGYDYFNKRR